jgi:hypothetical protein
MGERDAAQAVALIRALSDVRDKMVSQVTWLEKHDSQSDAVALRRDITEAQTHIVGLQRRYLGAKERFDAQQRPLASVLKLVRPATRDGDQRPPDER